MLLSFVWERFTLAYDKTEHGRLSGAVWFAVKYGNGTVWFLTVMRVFKSKSRKLVGPETTWNGTVRYGQGDKFAPPYCILKDDCSNESHFAVAAIVFD